MSLDYAPAFRGLIPERVEAVTSVTPKRGRYFATPVGAFDDHVNAPGGMELSRR